MIRWYQTIASKIVVRDIVNFDGQPREVVGIENFTDGSLLIRVSNGTGTGYTIFAFSNNSPIKKKMADCAPCYDSDCDCVFGGVL